MANRVGMYPSPFLDDRWHTEANPQVKLLAKAIGQAGWEVVPLTLDDLFCPQWLIQKEISVLHLHWPDPILNRLVRLKLFDHAPGGGSMGQMLRRLEGAIKIRYPLPETCFAQRPLSQISNWTDALQRTQIPLVWEIHDLFSHAAGSHDFFSKAGRLLFQNIYQLAQGVVIHEQSCSRPVFEVYRPQKPFAVAPLGDYAEVYGPPRSRTEARASLNLGRYKRVLAYVGTARKNRNPARAVQVFRQVASSEDVLVVAGQRVSRYAKEAQSPRVMVIDKLVPKEMLRDIFCAADFIVNDAQNYLTSAVVRTAMGYGVPVIAYPFGSTLDMAKDAAIFMEDGGRPGLEKAMRTALQIDDRSYQLMAQAALQRNSERGWAQMGAACVDLYRRLEEI